MQIDISSITIVFLARRRWRTTLTSQGDLAAPTGPRGGQAYRTWIEGLRLRGSCARVCERRCEPGKDHEVDPELHSVPATDPGATETKVHLQPTEFALDGVSTVVQVPPPSRVVRHHRMKTRGLAPYARGTTLVCGAFPLRAPLSAIRAVERPRSMNTDGR